MGGSSPPQLRDSNRSALQKSVLAALYSSEGSVMEVRCVPPKPPPAQLPGAPAVRQHPCPHPACSHGPGFSRRGITSPKPSPSSTARAATSSTTSPARWAPRPWHLSHATPPARAEPPHPFWTPSSPSLDPALGMQGLAGSTELIAPAILPGPAGLSAHAGPHEGHHLGHRPGPPPAHLQGPPEDGRR